MNNCIVNTDTACRRHLQDTIDALLLVREDVQPQRFLVILNEADSFLDTSHCHKRKNGTKNLILHHSVVRGDVSQDGRRDVTIIFVDLVAVRYLGWVDQFLETSGDEEESEGNVKKRFSL